MKGTCWQCGYALSSPVVTMSVTNKNGTKKSVKMHKGCAEQWVGGRKHMDNLFKTTKGK